MRLPSMNNRYAFGRSIQLLGLLIMPLGIAAEVFGQVSLGQSLLIAGVGMLIFYVGKRVQPQT